MTTIPSKQADQYSRQLWDIRWKKLRERILTRDRHQCRSCGQYKELQVHHRQYHRDCKTGNWKKPWQYESRLLVTLCASCHLAGHRLYPIPVKDI